jgi:MFS family permease
LNERRAERLFQLQVQRDLTRNYTAHLIHGMLGQTGFRLVNAPTFMPAFLMLLSGGSQLMVGLGLSLQALGMMLTPMIGASLIEHRPKVLPLGFSTGWAMRGSILAIGLAGYFLPPRPALVSILVLLALFGAFQGIQGVIFNFLMSKVIPPSKRGRLTGARNFLAGVISALVAWLGGHYLIGANPTSEGFALTFLLSFVLTSLGLSALTLVREPVPPTLRPNVSFMARVRDVPALMRDDPAFTRYVLARTVATAGRMALPFYMLYAGQTIGLTGQTLGIVTFAFTLAGTISNLLWGVLSDRFGFRAAFLYSLALWTVATLALMLTTGLVATAIVFAAIGAAVQGFQNASINLSLEFGSREDLPMRIAISNMVSETAGAIGPLVGGALAAAAGYSSVFVASMVFLAVGGLIVARYVPEPRRALPRA